MNDTQSTIIHLLRCNGVMTVRNLALRLGVSSIGISKSLSILEKRGIVRLDKTGNGGRGRPEHAVSLADTAGFALGISFKTSEVELALVDFRNVVRASSRVGFNIAQSQMDFTTVVTAIRKLLGTVESVSLSAIGLSLSGEFDFKTGRVYEANDFASCEQVEKLRSVLMRKFHTPVTIVHDTDAQMVAERWCNHGLPESPNMLFVGERLGFSLMLDGRLIRGSTHWKRWLGDQQVYDSKAYGDGFLSGALAASASISSWIDRQSHVTFGQRRDWKSDDFEENFRNLAALYKNNDREARKFVDRTGRDLGVTIRGLCLLLPFDRVIMNGWPPVIMERILELVNASLDEGIANLRQRRSGATRPPVSTAILNEQTEVAGSALLAIDQLLHSRMARRGRQEFDAALFGGFSY